MKSLRHTASHIMAQAVKHIWPEVKLAIGPAIENGYYYDFDMEHRLTEEDLKKIEKEMKKIVKQNLKLEREVISRAEAEELFKDEPYKLELIKDIPEGEDISTYRQGDFVDLCAGPHVESTGKVKALKLMSVAGAYWRGDEHNKMLQRIYGTAFESQEELEEYLKNLKEAEESDHRKLGRELELFGVHEEAPGMPYFYPRGMVIWNKLIEYWREQHEEAGYEEIMTPTIMRRELWETSGHWDHYAQGMYTLKIDDEDYAIKPMNCPGSIGEYGRKTRSYRGKALKCCELGRVFRYEKSGQLHGLLRVRSFTQDDAHIFIMARRAEEEETAIGEEIKKIMDLMKKMYSVFGLRWEVEISTRPEGRIGSEEMWGRAEGALMAATRGEGAVIREGEGAFYGPKIDVYVKDRMGRRWQCGTIQLDFNLPERFGLEYTAEGGERRRPVMIHRVIYGSIERFIGVITEHYGGKYPLWLIPEQARVISLSARGREIYELMKSAGVRVGLDEREESVSKRVKRATLMKIPYIMVVGERDGERLRVKVLGGESRELSAQELIALIKEKEAKKTEGY